MTELFGKTEQVKKALPLSISIRGWEWQFFALKRCLLLIFCFLRKKLLAYTYVYDIIIDRKEVKTLSKKKKSGNKKDQPASTINLITAIINLVIAILLIEKLTR